VSPFADFLFACAAPAEEEGLDLPHPVAVLGVGKVAVTAGLLEAIARHRPRGVLLFGVAGAFPERHRRPPSPPPVAPGGCCLVASDLLGDDGVATPDGFRSLDELGIGANGPFAADSARTRGAATTLGVPTVRGVTMSTGSGSEATSRAIAGRSGADVETMEGAAVAWLCHRAALPFVQLRAISNWTGDRARGAWDLGAAVRAVQGALRRLVAAG
jgi:futalosine hydrolase